MNLKSVADFEGPWTEQDFHSGLIERCKEHWEIPISQLPDVMVATFLNQQIALVPMIDEARRRIEFCEPDDTELFEGQLREALERALRRERS